MKKDLIKMVGEEGCILRRVGGFLFITILCNLLAGCSGNNKPVKEVAEVDISKSSYPEKVINLKDIADVSYVRFEDQEDFLFDGYPTEITENILVIGNAQSGDIFLFSKDGKPVSGFNHKGNGPGEYTFIANTFYEEEADELFVVSFRNIQVYSGKGIHIRTIDLPEGVGILEIANFDMNSFLIFDRERYSRMVMSENPGEWIDPDIPSCYIRISKKDGSIIEYVPVPEDYSIKLNIPNPQGMPLGVPQHHIVNYKDGYLLLNQELDTVFFYNKELKLTPVWVKTPSTKTMDPKIIINGFVEAGNYQFFEKTILKFNPDYPPPYFSDYLVRDKQTGEIYKQKVVLDDYKGKEIRLVNSVIRNSNDSKTGVLQFNLDELKEAYEENRLSGELKDIVASMKEDENNILVLLYFK